MVLASVPFCEWRVYAAVIVEQGRNGIAYGYAVFLLRKCGGTKANSIRKKVFTFYFSCVMIGDVKRPRGVSEPVLRIGRLRPILGTRR